MKLFPVSIVICGAIGLQLFSSPSVLRADAPAQADTATEALDYTLTCLCTEFIAELHQQKNNEQAQQFIARRYYAVLFTVWLGSQLDPHLRAYDLRDYIRAFLRTSAKDGFSSLIDYNDPLGWARVPAGVDSSDLIQMIGSSPFHQRVLEQTKDQGAYKDAVRRFRELFESVKAAP